MTQLWGIVNATPDSFSDGGRFLDADTAIAQAGLLVAQGATVIDVGGESTRPGAERVGVAEEERRVIPVIEALCARGVTTSVDTMNAATALSAIQAGARYVNDVSAGLGDPEMLSTVASTHAEIVLGHWRGPSADMYAHADYRAIGREVAAELQARIVAAAKAGISPDRIIVDPGIGFAKTPEQSWQLLHELRDVLALGFRVMIGTSRKRLLSELLPAEPSLAQRDAATAATSAIAAHEGVWAVRVHDVASSAMAVRVADAWARRS